MEILNHLILKSKYNQRAYDCSCNLIRVSSVLNDDLENNGKQNMFDGREDTCWNSANVENIQIFSNFLLGRTSLSPGPILPACPS